MTRPSEPAVPPPTVPEWFAFQSEQNAPEWNRWRWQHGHRLRSVAEVCAAFQPPLSFRPEVDQGMREAEQSFPVSTTPYYLALADPRNPRDPILPQILPDPAELCAAGNGDPFAETELMIAEGVVHRYHDRVLFLLTNYCSTLCRHCMRKREWQRPFARLSESQIDEAVAMIAETPGIRDVLLSGGDPFNLPPAYLGSVLRRLRRRTDLDCIRFGSRVPVTFPQRIDAEFVSVLEPHAPLYLNTHFNHAREVTSAAIASVRRLQGAGVIVSNQAVLLRSINDTEEDLLQLSRALLRAGVRAYYLHHCDPVRGTEHFRVGLGRAIRLVHALRGRVSGLAIPQLVVDLPGGGGKVQADGAALLRIEQNTYVYQSPITGEEIGVDGSEGGFHGIGAWSVVPDPKARYAAGRS